MYVSQKKGIEIVHKILVEKAFSNFIKNPSFKALIHVLNEGRRYIESRE